MALLVAACVAIAAGVGYLSVRPEPVPERLRAAARDDDGVRDPRLGR